MGERPTSYQLITQADTLASKLMQAEGDEQIDAILAEEAAWKDDVLIKLEAHRHVRKALFARAAHFKEQAQQLQNRAVRIADNIRALDDRALALVSTYEESTGNDRAKLSDGSWVRSNHQESHKVVITDTALLDPYYTETVIRPDKALIRRDIAKGAMVEGAELQANTTHSIRWSS
jgi:hypothetical protein